MERNWCCPEFQSNATNVERKVGFRVALAWKGRRPFLCLLEFARKEKNRQISRMAGWKSSFVHGAELT